MLLGEVIGASRRCASDWPTEMVNDNELESAAKEFADGPAAQPRLAVSGARRAIDTVWHMSADDALRVAVVEQVFRGLHGSWSSARRRASPAMEGH